MFTTRTQQSSQTSTEAELQTTLVATWVAAGLDVHGRNECIKVSRYGLYEGWAG